MDRNTRDKKKKYKHIQRGGLSRGGLIGIIIAAMCCLAVIAVCVAIGTRYAYDKTHKRSPTRVGSDIYGIPVSRTKSLPYQ